ncbi:MAG: histidine ammonia-lyase [Bacteroidota bacterium]|jgi:histidine ammonia-lyase
MKSFQLGIDCLTVSDAMHMANGETKAQLSASALDQVDQSAQWVQDILDQKRTVYGINTGFGVLANTAIDAKDAEILQHKILQSHSVGVGDPVSPEIVRLMLITKIHALAYGHSGIRTQTIQRMLWHLEQDVLPIVPEKGSVGASGDLAPLSHLCLPLIGMGEVIWKGERMPTQAMFQKTGLSALSLGPKEGLALINGTQFILAHAVSGVSRFQTLLSSADIIGALSLEALQGTNAPFDERLHRLRPFKGSKYVAHRLRELLNGSENLVSHADCERVQDPYSLRCMPQVHGASRSAWLHLKQLTEVELNSVTDNPVLFSAEDSISGGNFHGQPLALPLDYACLAAAEIGNISDRRSYLLIEGKFGLPTLLMENIGLNSGLMIPQYTSAALVTENKTLCFPASADSIPTSLGQEDHVSMGSISGRKLHQVLDNLEYILAVELLSAVQGFEFRRPLKTSPILESVIESVHEIVSYAKEDRIFSIDLERLRNYIHAGELVKVTASQFSAKGNDEYPEFQL